MNIAVATMSAVSRVRCETRLGSSLIGSVMPPLWDGSAAEESAWRLGVHASPGNGRGFALPRRETRTRRARVFAPAIRFER